MAKFSYNGNILGWSLLGHAAQWLWSNTSIFPILCRYVVDIYVPTCQCQQNLSITPLVITTVELVNTMFVWKAYPLQTSPQKA